MGKVSENNRISCIPYTQ